MNPKHGPFERTLATELGQHIYRARVAMGAKQEVLAEVMGLGARGSVSNWEHGKRLIRERDWNALRQKAEMALPEYQEIRTGVVLRFSAQPMSQGSTDSFTVAASAA